LIRYLWQMPLHVANGAPSGSGTHIGSAYFDSLQVYPSIVGTGELLFKP
jgi:hypothetical protein